MIKSIDDKIPEYAFLSLLKSTLKSYWMAAVLLFFGFFCWFTNNTLICVFVYLAIFLFTIFLLEDVKTIFCLVLYVPFFINDIVADPNWACYIGAIACAITGLVGYLVRSILLNGKKLKKGKMLNGFLFALIAFTFAGVGRVSIMPVLITWALFIATYVFYFIAINGTEDFGKYLCFLFFIGAVVLVVQNIINCLRHEGILSLGNPVFYCAENVNTIALFMVFGIIGAFGLGMRKKYDFLAIISMPIFLFGTIISCCRVAFAICALATAVLSVILVIYSPRKRYILIPIVAAIFVAMLFVVWKWETLIEILKNVLTKGNKGVNGRDDLWEWCWQRFIEYPVFGYGMVADGSVPTLRDVGNLNLVLAHNTVLQWLTSLGIVGSVFISVFYFYKYYVVLKGFNADRIWVLAGVLVIALAGTLDQSPAMDYFTFLLPLLCVASTENVKNKNLIRF